MEVISSNAQYQERLSRSIQRILSTCTSDTGLLIEQSPIIIIHTSDLQNYSVHPNLMWLARKTLSVGYGVSLARIPHKSVLKHIVVLNMELMDELNLEEYEIDAVISHELGHLLPNIPLNSNNTEIGTFKQEIQAQKEFHADYFCKKTSTVDGLLSSMNKYTNSKYCNDTNNIALFERRIEMLGTDEEFVGIPKSLF